MQPQASQRLTLRIHSGNTAASISVSRQNASPRRGQPCIRLRTVSCEMNIALVAVSEAKLWSITSRCRLCKSGMSPGMEREYLALAFLGQLVAVGEPFQDQTALSRAVALAHEVLPRMRAATARG